MTRIGEPRDKKQVDDSLLGNEQKGNLRLTVNPVWSDKNVLEFWIVIIVSQNCEYIKNH